MFEGRYRIPLFSAPYYEAALALQPDNELAMLTISFQEGGGVAFHTHLTRARDQWEVDRNAVEALRTCVY